MNRFDESEHKYYIGEMEVPSVTSILKDVGLIKDNGYYTEASRIRGKAIHAAIELHLKNNLDRDSLDPRILPYLDGFERFEEDTHFKTIAIEDIKKMCSALTAREIIKNAHI